MATDYSRSGRNTASGRRRWPNRDPIGIDGGINPYAFVANDPINHVDPIGLTLSKEEIEDLKREIELIQKMRELAQKMIENLENGKPQCLGASSPVAFYCNCFANAMGDCNNFANCLCVQLPEDRACKKRALKACGIAKKIVDAYNKAKGKYSAQ
jgi:hypothetical protein